MPIFDPEFLRVLKAISELACSVMMFVILIFVLKREKKFRRTNGDVSQDS